jgi:hypothetical protein
MSNTLYANTPTNVSCTHGGAIGVDAAAAATQLTSTSVACRVLRLSTSSTNTVHWSVGSTNVSLGALVPQGASTLIGVDDASKIFVFASTAASVFCTYMG